MSYFLDDATVDKWEFPPTISGRWISRTDSAFSCTVQWGNHFNSDSKLYKYWSTAILLILMTQSYIDIDDWQLYWLSGLEPLWQWWQRIHWRWELSRYSSNDNDIHQMLHIFTTSITHQDLQHVIEKFIQAMQ